MTLLNQFFAKVFATCFISALITFLLYNLILSSNKYDEKIRYIIRKEIVIKYPNNTITSYLKDEPEYENREIYE